MAVPGGCDPCGQYRLDLPEARSCSLRRSSSSCWRRRHWLSPCPSRPAQLPGRTCLAKAAAIVERSQSFLPVDAAGAFGALLIGLGLVNVVWGGAAAWLTESEAAAWRYSFVADWGLLLCGLGLIVADGQRAAILVLFSIVLCRLPLCLVSLEAPREKAVTRRPVSLVVAAALAGSAPFAGFAARLLLLRAATQLFWPLAVVLAAGLLLWLPGSLRLGRSLGLPRGRQAVGVALVLAVNVAVGLYPLPLLLAAHL